ncbi:MAG: hypothetical protein JJ900_14515 [Rhodospirillales bacterium]|nr:hypothetical protein [Rhodospirillales bacterium]
MRKRCILYLLMLLGSVSPVAAEDLVLPPVGASGFKSLCEDMYRERDTAAGWPRQIHGAGHYCTLTTPYGDATVMSADDYAWTLRKSLTFACKGKREVIYELVRRLKDCDGEIRTLDLTPAETEGACRVAFDETADSFVAGKPLIADLVDWRDNMPWYERILVDLFAPGELPEVMDGLIACGGMHR